jgi:anti-anti-sigma factor
VTENPELSNSYFTVDLQQGGDSACIRVSGTYGPELLARFETELQTVREARLRQLIVDLHALGSADAEGLDALLGRWSGKRRNGIRLILVRVPKHLRGRLEETGLDRQLPIAYEGPAPGEPRLGNDFRRA